MFLQSCFTYDTTDSSNYFFFSLASYLFYFKLFISQGYLHLIVTKSRTLFPHCHFCQLILWLLVVTYNANFCNFYLISLLCHLCAVSHQVLLFLPSQFQIYFFYQFPTQVCWKWGNYQISGSSHPVYPSQSSEDHLLYFFRLLLSFPLLFSITEH